MRMCLRAFDSRSRQIAHLVGVFLASSGHADFASGPRLALLYGAKISFDNFGAFLYYDGTMFCWLMSCLLH